MHGSSSMPFLSRYQSGKPLSGLTGPNFVRPFVLAVLSSPVTIEPDGAPSATPTVASTATSARNTMLRRGLPATSRRIEVRGDTDEPRVRDRSTFASVPRSIRDKVPPWSTTWFDSGHHSAGRGTL